MIMRAGNDSTKLQIFSIYRNITFKMTSFGDVQPFNSPVNLTPITLGHFNSQGISAMTSTASAPPTPMHKPPRPPPLGVWESVPTINKPKITRIIQIIIELRLNK